MIVFEQNLQNRVKINFQAFYIFSASFYEIPEEEKNRLQVYQNRVEEISRQTRQAIGNGASAKLVLSDYFYDYTYTNNDEADNWMEFDGTIARSEHFPRVPGSNDDEIIEIAKSAFENLPETCFGWLKDQGKVTFEIIRF